MSPTNKFKAAKAIAPNNVKKKKRKSKDKASRDSVVDDGGPNLDGMEASRISFTKGWMQSLNVKESLPIKRPDGKVVHIKRMEADKADDKSTDNESEPEGQLDQPNLDHDIDSIFEDPFDSTTPSANNDNDSSRADLMSNKKIGKELTPARRLKLRGIVSDICMQITSDPEESLKKRKLQTATESTDADGKPTVYSMKDLFQYMEHSDAEISELAMLSGLLVFKDIAPGYRIRQSDEESTSTDTKLKKETQRIRDFELSLLAAYQRYLRHLEARVKMGLGNPKRDITEWTPQARLGLSALRCQCELLRWLPYFNFRSSLLNAVAIRAAQCNSEVSTMCSQALQQVFTADNDGEVSFEAVKTISKIIMAFKYEVPPDLVRCLQAVKLAVHADDAKKVRMQSKKERRKRRRSEDDVETGLMESTAVADKTVKQRYQVDTLQEIALMYFRYAAILALGLILIIKNNFTCRFLSSIVKQKIGFALLPAALEGLGCITHLINFDMVADLVPVLRSIIQRVPAVSLEVKLLCIHCVLKTLLGPGEELQADDEAFVMALKDLITDVPFAGFTLWNQLLEAIEMLLLKRRETRSSLIFAVVNRLLVWSCHLHPPPLAATTLCLAHAILLRYPKLRVNGQVFQMASRSQDNDDTVVDLAMKALRESAATKAQEVVDSDGDASRVLPLLRHSLDARTRRVAATMVATDVLPLPYRLQEAKGGDDESTVEQAVQAFGAIPSSHPSSAKFSKGNSSGKQSQQRRSVKGFDPQLEEVVVPQVTNNFFQVTSKARKVSLGGKSISTAMQSLYSTF